MLRKCVSQFAWHHERCFSARLEVPQGLAAVREVRSGTGNEEAAWVKTTLATYFKRPEHLSYRAETAWSLRQIDDRFTIFKPDSIIVDLGCFPGGWSQVALERTFASSSSSAVIGIDVVKMDPLENHTFIQGEAAEEETSARLLEVLGERRADVVISDMARPTTGLKMEDHMESLQCCLLASKLMERSLRIGGWFVVKLAWGADQQHFRTYLDSRFDKIRTIKPPSSRPVHREMFYVCRGFNGRQSISEEVGLLKGLKNEGVDKWDYKEREIGPIRM